MNKNFLLKYAINYLSKYNSSKKNLERILKSKILRITKIKKERFELYSKIEGIIVELEKNNLINDKFFIQSKINFFSLLGKSKLFIKSYLIKKGVEKNIIEEQFYEFEEKNNDWEKKSAFIFAKKKKLLDNNKDINKSLAKMSRAGFSYEICKEILGIS